MPEIILNLHMHTRYSDGAGLHKDIASAAMRAGLDAVLVTDHNVLVGGPAGYYKEGNRRVLLMVGEEVHDLLPMMRIHVVAVFLLQVLDGLDVLQPNNLAFELFQSHRRLLVTDHDSPPLTCR